MLLNDIQSKKANWVGLILRKKFIIHDSVERHMIEVKGVGRKRTQFLE